MEEKHSVETMKHESAINKHFLKMIIVILILVVQIWGYVSHQRMVNSRLNKINRLETEVYVLEQQEGDIALIELKLQRIDSLTLDIMPLERRLKYLEISFLLYPAVLYAYVNFFFTEKKVLQSDKMMWKTFKTNLNPKNIIKTSRNHPFKASTIILTIAFITYMGVWLINSSKTYTSCDPTIEYVSYVHGDKIIIDKNNPVITNQITIYDSCGNRLTSSSVELDNYNPNTIGYYDAHLLINTTDDTFIDEHVDVFVIEPIVP